MSRFALFVLWLVAQLAHVAASLRMLGYIIVGSPRGKRILLAYDRLGNVALGGDDRETISSRANRGRAEGATQWCVLCRILDWLEPNHCRDSAGV